MHFDITKNNGKLSVENLSCDCPMNHEMPGMDIYIRRGLIDGCGDCVAQSGLKGSVLIVADGNTYEIAARTIEKSMKASGFSARTYVLPGEKIEPTPQMAELIVSAAGGADFLLSVGSGVVTDLTRRAAFLRKHPYAAFGTAASMDGYTSVTSAMMENGTKVSEYAYAAKLLMFDPEIIATAPPIMHASGVGDVYAKYNVLVDWKLGAAVAGEIYCPLCGGLIEAALDKCSSNINSILKRTPEGAQALIESLILAGLTVLIVGDTRPVASIEHNMAHLWDMNHVAYGEPCPPHGVCAGICLIYALLMHEFLRKADLSSIDEESVRSRRMTKAQKEAFIMKCYPNNTGADIIKANKNWYEEWPAQQKRLRGLVSYHEQYKKISLSLPAYRDIIDIFDSFGVPSSATKFGLSMKRLEETLLVTKDFRPRYSIPLALSDLGLLEECAAGIMEIEKTL